MSRHGSCIHADEFVYYLDIQYLHACNVNGYMDTFLHLHTYTRIMNMSRYQAYGIYMYVVCIQTYMTIYIFHTHEYTYLGIERIYVYNMHINIGTYIINTHMNTYTYEYVQEETDRQDMRIYHMKYLNR